MGMTIQDVIDFIIATVPEAPLEDTLGFTLDTIKTGNPLQAVKGITTTFRATSEVIEKTVEVGANLIISHEGTVYENQDETSWRHHDPVYKATRRLIDENDIVVWQFHDYWHLHRPDGILTGLLKEFGWENQAEAGKLAQMNTLVKSVADYYAMVKTISHVNIPPTSLLDLAEMFKEKLDIQQVRIVGHPDLLCSRLVLMPGRADGNVQMEWLGQDDVNVLVCGEIKEGEPDEYVRDAIHHQQKKGMIILGHANSEEVGMKWCAEWLRTLLPEVEITHLPAGDPFRFV